MGRPSSTAPKSTPRVSRHGNGETASAKMPLRGRQTERTREHASPHRIPESKSRPEAPRAEREALRADQNDKNSQSFQMPAFAGVRRQSSPFRIPEPKSAAGSPRARASVQSNAQGVRTPR